MGILQQLDNRFQRAAFVVSQGSATITIVLLIVLFALVAEGKDNRFVSYAFAVSAVIMTASLAAFVTSQNRHRRRN